MLNALPDLEILWAPEQFSQLKGCPFTASYIPLPHGFKSSQGQNIYVEKNPSECMRSGCCRPVAVVSQAYPGNAEMCPGFPSRQAALVTAAAGDKGIWVVWCSSDELRLRQREGSPHRQD